MTGFFVHYLINMWNTEIESKIVEYGRRKEKKELAAIREMLLKRHYEANYMLSRFMHEYGDQLDDDKNCMSLFKTLSDEYSTAQRLLTILSAYDK